MIVLKSFKVKSLHLLFFPLLFVVNHFFVIATPHQEILVNSLWAWIANFILATFLCFCLPFLLSKLFCIKMESGKSQILATIIFIPFFFAQDIFFFADQIAEGFIRARWIFPLFGVFLLLSCYYVIKSNGPLQLLREFLNTLSFLLICYTVIVLIFSWSEKKAKPLNFTPPISTLRCQNCPDIYFFILDSYSSNKSLREYFHFDNADFTKQLQILGFHVSDESVSSYPNTVFSLGATLNLDSLKNLDLYNNTPGILDVIKSNTVIKSLQHANYEFHNYSLFDISDQSKYYSVTSSFPIGFINGIIQSSVLNLVIDFSKKMKWYGVHIKILDQVSYESRQKSAHPKIVYAHLLAPHAPFVIDSLGREIELLNIPNNKFDNDAYINQVKGISRLIYPRLKTIVENSPSSIIIIMGDHGYRHLEGANRQKESTSVFLAYKGAGPVNANSLKYSHKIFSTVFKELQSNP